MSTLMLQETLSAPERIAVQLATNRTQVDVLAKRLRERGIRGVVTAARGSSDHAASYFSYLCMARLELPAASLPLTTLHAAPWQLDRQLALAVSQSGQSFDLLDTLKALKVATMSDQGRAYIEALGGSTNLTLVSACTTRLRLAIADPQRINDAALKGLSARGVLRLKRENVQVVIGPMADVVADEIKEALATDVPMSVASSATEEPPVSAEAPSSAISLPSNMLEQWHAALGGHDNLTRCDMTALTQRVCA